MITPASAPDHADRPSTSRFVVVGVDFTEPSVIAAKWSAAHLLDGRELVLAHAICIPEPPRFLRGMHAPIEPVIADARRGAELRLRELSASLGIGRVWPEIRVGRPHEVIAAVAAEYDADLAVLGPHGPRPGMWKLLGSSAERVIRDASRSSVMLARNLPGTACRSILVGLDDADLTPALVETAGGLAARWGATATVMHVVNPMVSGAVTIAAAEPERRRAEAQLREHAHSWLRERIAGTALEGARIEVAFGDPGLELLAATERHGADLVVVGRNASVGSPASALGSTSAFLLRNGRGPLLVVAAGPE